MKTIPLKSESGVEYAPHLKQLVAAPPNDNGFGLQEMRQAIRVLDILDTDMDTVDLEDADYNYLKTRIEKARFKFAHKDILCMVDDILSAV